MRVIFWGRTSGTRTWSGGRGMGPFRPQAAKRATRKLFDVVNTILSQRDDPFHDQVAKRVVDRATNCTPDLLESRVHVRLRPERNDTPQFPKNTLVSRWGRPWGKVRLNWARREAPGSVHDRPYATARLCTLRSVSCRVQVGSASYGGDRHGKLQCGRPRFRGPASR
jgi:hypothetical protein